MGRGENVCTPAQGRWMGGVGRWGEKGAEGERNSRTAGKPLTQARTQKELCVMGKRAGEGAVRGRWARRGGRKDPWVGKGFFLEPCGEVRGQRSEGNRRAAMRRGRWAKEPPHRRKAEDGGWAGVQGTATRTDTDGHGRARTARRGAMGRSEP